VSKQPSPEDALDRLLLQWEEAKERGEELTAEQLCAECPELLEPLRRQIALLKKMAWMEQEVAELAEGPQAGADPLPGQVLLGRYRIEQLLSQGGFGRVYRGFDLELQRPVAVKVARPDRPLSEKLAESLLQEARRAAKLRHPGVVSVYDVVRHQGQVFIISQLVVGQSLAEVLEQRRFSPPEAAELVAKVAEAVQHAHDCGFVHLDIKPGNILLDSRGQPLLTDFGIAITREQLAQQEAITSGTLPYMAPEQVAGEVSLVDFPADIHALGVLLYELLTGELPYQGKTPAELRQQILFRHPPAPRQQHPQLPAALEAVCLKALAKHPADRFASAGEMARALHEARHKAEAHKWLHRFSVVIGLVGLLAAVGWGVWTVQKSLPKQPAGPGEEHAPEIIWATRLEPATFAPCVVFSPTGDMIAAGGMDNTIRLLDAATGRELGKLQGHESWVRCLSWSPEGQRLLSGSGGANINGKVHLGSDHSVRVWSVKGRKELFCLKGHVAPVVTVAVDWEKGHALTGSNDGTVRLWDLEQGKELWQFSPQVSSISAIAWAIGDRHLFVGGRDGVIRLWLLEPRKQIAVMNQHHATVKYLCLSPDRKYLLSCSSDHTVCLWNREGKLLRVYPHPNRVTWAAFTPQGRRFATGCLDGIVRFWSLASKRPLKEYRGHQGGVLAVAFSPDGKQLVSTSNDGTVRLWRVPDFSDAEHPKLPGWSDLYPPEEAKVLAFDGHSCIVTPLERFAPVTIEAWVRPKSYLAAGCQFIVGATFGGLLVSGWFCAAGSWPRSGFPCRGKTPGD